MPVCLPLKRKLSKLVSELLSWQSEIIWSSNQSLLQKIFCMLKSTKVHTKKSRTQSSISTNRILSNYLSLALVELTSSEEGLLLLVLDDWMALSLRPSSLASNLNYTSRHFELEQQSCIWQICWFSNALTLSVTWFVLSSRSNFLLKYNQVYFFISSHAFLMFLGILLHALCPWLISTFVTVKFFKFIFKLEKQIRLERSMKYTFKSCTRGLFHHFAYSQKPWYTHSNMCELLLWNLIDNAGRTYITPSN